MSNFLQESYASENALCIAFVKNLRNRQRLGLMRPCIWFHIVNEQPRQKNGSKTAGAIIGKRLNDMGRKAGVLDYQFIWQDAFGNTQIGFLEAKQPGGKSQPSQDDFIFDCKQFGIQTAVFRSVQEGLRHLEGWGVLRTETFN